MSDLCPICQVEVPIEALEAHVNRCLDGGGGGGAAARSATLDADEAFARALAADNAAASDAGGATLDADEALARAVAAAEADLAARKRSKLTCIVCNDAIDSDAALFVVDGCYHKTVSGSRCPQLSANARAD